MHNFGRKLCPEGVTRPRREPIRKKRPTTLAKTQPLNLFVNRFKLAKIAAHTRVRIKRLVITPLGGVIPPLRGGKGAGKPKADHATTKEISCLSLCRIRMGLLAPSDRDRRSR